jgi:hypothetical protein
MNRSKEPGQSVWGGKWATGARRDDRQKLPQVPLGEFVIARISDRRL